MESRHWLRDILGGDLLVKEGISDRLRYFFLLFVLVILYIAISFNIDHSLKMLGQNSVELKHLHSIYLNKSAILQHRSTREEVEKMLVKMGSTLKPLSDPPLRVIVEGKP